MRSDGERARKVLKEIGVTVGGVRREWFGHHNLPVVRGDRDILAFHKRRRILLVAEAEGISGAQPEQKLYKAIGQIVMAASEEVPIGWNRRLFLVVHGKSITEHLSRVIFLEQLGVSAISIEDYMVDRWIFGSPP